MKYHQDKFNYKYFFYLLPILFIFFWFGSFFDPRPILSKFFSGMIIPVWEIKDNFTNSLSEFFVLFEDKIKLQKENKLLKDRYLVSNSILNENRLLREENKSFRDFFNINDGFYLKEISDRLLKEVYFAHVAFGSPKKPYDTLILDRGSVDSVGLIVFNSRGYVIGDIIESSNKYSKVRLFSSYGRKISAFLGNNKTIIEVEGLGNGNFKTLVPKDFSVTLGEQVIYPGSKFLFLGVVKEIISEDNLPTKEIYFSAPFNLNEINLVFVSR